RLHGKIAGGGLSRVEGTRERVGVEHGCVQCLLEILHPVEDPQQRGEGPLVLLVTAGGTDGQDRPTVLPGHECGGQGGAGTASWGQCVGRGRVEPEHLPAGPERQPQVRDDGGTGQPSSTGCGRDHVARGIHHVHVTGVAALVGGGERVDHRGFTRGAVLVCAVRKVQSGQEGCAAVDGAGTLLQTRLLLVDKGGPPVGVLGAQQFGEGNVGEVGIAVPGLTVGEGEFGGLHDAVHEVDIALVVYPVADTE